MKANEQKNGDWANKTTYDVMKTKQFAHEMSKALQVMDRLTLKVRSHPYKELQRLQLNNVLGITAEYKKVVDKTSKLSARQRGLVAMLCERVLMTVIRQELQKQPDLMAEYERRKSENEKQLEKLIKETE